MILSIQNRLDRGLQVKRQLQVKRRRERVSVQQGQEFDVAGGALDRRADQTSRWQAAQVRIRSNTS